MTTVAGRYGGPLLQEAKLIVQGREWPMAWPGSM